MKIYDYKDIQENLYFYSGNAGTKMGFIKENGENWFLKFPKSTKNFENVEISYTTSPLSEFIGSHIYEILGFDVHKTELGIYNDKVVVACKDFTEDNFRLYELKAIANANLKDKEEIREKYSSESNYYYDIEELKFIFENNSILKNLPKFIDNFFDMIVVDSFINNNDRHLGNFGVLINNKDKEIKLAPIYDNGNSFFSKHSDEQFKNILESDNYINSMINNNKIPYLLNGKNLDSIKIIKNLTFGRDDKNNFLLPDFDKNLKEAIIRVVPKIKEKMNEINSFIGKIPENYNNIQVLPKKQKEFYILFLNEKLDKILLPALNKINEKEKNPWSKKLENEKSFGIGD